jgi:hypothetical protein
MRDKIAQKDHAHDHTLHYGRSHPILAVAMIHHNLQQVGKPLSTRRYSARLTRHKLENNMTPRSMQGFISVG